MRRVILSSLAALAVATSHASAQPPTLPDLNGRSFMPGQVVLQLGPRAQSQADVADIVNAISGTEARRGIREGRWLVTLREGESVENALRTLRTHPDVEFAEPNYIRRLSITPNDPAFFAQWNFRMLSSERMWDIQQGAASVTVAVVDSGVATEDLPPQILNVGPLFGIPSFLIRLGPFARAPDWGSTQIEPGFDAVYGTGHAFDDTGHGTHVASTIAQSFNNGIGAVGLAPGVALMPIKACLSVPRTNAQGVCLSFSIAEGIDFATDNGADVINLSLGGAQVSEAERIAIERAVGRGVIIVAAAGNENDVVGAPANLPGVIAVGAVDMRKQRAFYSNFGSEIEFVAPGGDTTVDTDGDGFVDGIFQQTYPSNAGFIGEYTQFGTFALQGTSMASPHVAAVVALLISQGITGIDAIRAVLQQTAEDLGPPGRDNNFGHGLIQPVPALTGLGLNQ